MAKNNALHRLMRQNFHLIKHLHPEISELQISTLRDLTTKLKVSVAGGEVVLI